MVRRVLLSLVFVASGIAARADAPAVHLPRTGQDACFGADGSVVACAGTGQDGDKRTGAAWPSPRFADNGDGTATDRLTGLIWLKNANCTDAAGGIDRRDGLMDWPSALAWCNNLASGNCGLSDNSVAGDWRLPNIVELRSLIDYSRHDPALSAGHPFSNVQRVWYWTSTTNPVTTTGAYNVGMGRGSIHLGSKSTVLPGGGKVGRKRDVLHGVWPVRGGR